jgi:hypothetical protein
MLTGRPSFLHPAAEGLPLVQHHGRPRLEAFRARQWISAGDPLPSRTSAATRSRSILLTAWSRITTLSRLAFMGRAWDRSGWLNRLQAAADSILAATVRMRT